MTNDAVLAILHHFFAFALLACLAAEWGLLLSTPERSIIQRLSLVDAGYGLAAVGSIVVGIARLHHGIKPASYFTNNPLFWAKMGIWASIGAISVLPTIRFIQWRKAKNLPTPHDFTSMRKWEVLELLLFTTLPTLAALMARGYQL